MNSETTLSPAGINRQSVHESASSLRYLRGTAVFFVLLLAWFATIIPQEAPAQLRGSSDKVSLTPLLAQDAVTPGSTFRAAVVLNIADSWHVNANRPTLDYLIGTEVVLDAHEGFIVADVVYPQPKTYEFAFAEGEALLVYEGDVPVFLELRAGSGLEPGRYELTGHAVVQACDDQNCLAPSRIPFTLVVDVVDQAETVTPIHQDLFDLYDDAATASEQWVSDRPGNEIETLFSERGMLLALLALFFIGLALNLTPCVYPMLTVTVSLFGGQSDTNILRVFSKAVVYVLGIATMYSLLGVLASFGGELFGHWLQHPWVLGSIGLLLFALALSMFGLYEIQVPYWLSAKLGTGTSTGYVATYLSGLVVGIFAAPCIGPPIIALLAFIGSRGDPVFGFWSFFILSLGLGFPYLILGTFSGLLPKLPKSGMWMICVKKVFGVVLTALALFYLAMPFFSVTEAYWVIPVSLIVGGVYLGFLESSGKGTAVFSKVKMAFGTLAVIAGLVAVMNLQKEGMEWEAYDILRLEQAKHAETPVILDFYADWCIPCLELDRITFTNADVIDATREMVRLKVDLTHFDSPESEELRRQYQVAGVPTIIFLDGRGNEVPGTRIVGFVGPDEFLRRLNLVRKDPL